MDPGSLWRLARIGRLGSSRLRLDDDFSDRFNYQITSILIFLLISVTGIRQYFGKPIQCWIPQEFTRGWEEYAESFCWVSNTYYASLHRPLPKYPQKEELKVSYYQWASIVLGVQALLFCMPCMIWRLLSVQSGFNLRRILQAANECNATLLNSEHSHKSIRFIAHHMDRCLRRKKIYGTGLKARIRRLGSYLSNNICFICCCCGRNSGTYLGCAYAVVKIFYLLNVIGQLYLMQKFIDTTYTFYGFQVLYDLIKGREWMSSGHFPRVTFCDFQAKKLGKNHLYTLQCVLPLNMFLEKIFIFLWFWHILVFLITLFSFVSWLTVLCSRTNRYKIIHEYLSLIDEASPQHKRYPITKEGPGGSKAFTNDYLQLDGVFIINLISLNVGEIVAGDVVCELWNHFVSHRNYFVDVLKKYEDPIDSKYLHLNANRNYQPFEDLELKQDFNNNGNNNNNNNNSINNDDIA